MNYLPGLKVWAKTECGKSCLPFDNFSSVFVKKKENELLCMISVVNFLKSRDFAIFVAAIFLGVLNFCCWYSSIFLSWPVFPSRDKTLWKCVLWFKNNTTNALIAVAGFNTFKHNFNLNFIHRTLNVREIFLSENQFIVRKLTTFPASSKT